MLDFSRNSICIRVLISHTSAYDICGMKRKKAHEGDGTMRIGEVFQRKISTRMYIPCIAGCILVLLLISLITVASRSGGRTRAIADARNSVAAAEYTELRAALGSFDTVGYPNADLMGDIMPTLRTSFHAANILEGILAGEYGTAYSLLDAEVYRYIQLTMDEIDNAFAQGQSTAQGVENLRVYMLLLKENLEGRFDANGALLPMG